MNKRNAFFFASHSLSPLVCRLFFLPLLFFLFSCGASRKATQKEDKTKTDIRNRSAKQLTEKLKENEFEFDFLSGKFGVDVITDDDQKSFKVNFRVKKDSMIWMSISKVGIQGARVLITTDTVKVVNYLHKTFFIGGLDYISTLLHSDVDFELLQSLLIGNSVSFYEEEEKLKASCDETECLLSTKRKKKVKKVMEKNKELREPLQSIWLHPNTFKITRILFNEFHGDGQNRSFDVTYNNFQPVDSALFPHTITCKIIAEKKIEIHLDYSKISTLNQNKLSFKIPDDYERIEYSRKE